MYTKLHTYSKDKQKVAHRLNQTVASIDRTFDLGNKRNPWTPVANGMIDEVYLKKTSKKKLKDTQNYEIPSPNRDFWTRVTTASGHQSPHQTTAGNKGSRGFSPVLHRVKSIENLNNPQKKGTEVDRKEQNYHLVNMFRTKTKKQQSTLNATRVHNISLKHIERNISPTLLQNGISRDKPNFKQLEGSIQAHLINKHHRLGPSQDTSISTQPYSSYSSQLRSKSNPALGLTQVLIELKSLTKKHMEIGKQSENRKNE